MYTSLLCPQCHAALDPPIATPGGLLCGGCGTNYPALGSIPLLLADPQTKLLEWSHALRRFVDETNHATSVLLTQLLEEELSPRAEKRVRLLVDSLPQHRDSVLSAFAEVDIEPAAAPPSTPFAESPASLLAYATLILRDYAWQGEVDEVGPALALLRSVCPPDVRLGRVLVVGAGTARLAWELALWSHCEEVIAIDINPLPLLLTQQLVQGKAVRFWELPGHPRRSTMAAQPRSLHAPADRPAHLRLMLADALKPPFPDQSFDTVVTPWFIDQVPSNLAEYLPILAGLLKEGGQWLNQGPLVYDPARTAPAHRYCGDEVMELVGRAGFSVTQAKYEPATYLVSPVSSQGRIEHVLTFHAVKTTSPVSSTPPTSTAPDWLTNHSSIPVPSLKHLLGAAHDHPLLLRLTQITNGQRTVRELTRALIAEGLVVDDETAEIVVRGGLKVLGRAGS